MTELLLILLVMVIVLPPKKWSMLIYHLAKALRFIQTCKHQLEALCKEQIKQYELEQNQKKAHQAEVQYKNNHLLF